MFLCIGSIFKWWKMDSCTGSQSPLLHSGESLSQDHIDIHTSHPGTKSLMFSLLSSLLLFGGSKEGEVCAQLDLIGFMGPRLLPGGLCFFLVPSSVFQGSSACNSSLLWLKRSYFVAESWNWRFRLKLGKTDVWDVRSWNLFRPAAVARVLAFLSSFFLFSKFW